MAGWDPWAEAGRRPSLEIWYADEPLGAAWHEGATGDVIVIDARADRRTRRALLAHELVHSERRIGFPAATEATMEREEAIVRREVAARLVPRRELADLVARRAEVEPITAAVVAEEFDVPEDVALQALSDLGRTGRPPEPPATGAPGARASPRA